MMKMAIYIVGSVLFGTIIGILYAKSRAQELYVEKEQKLTKIISDKNSAIISLKNDLRSIQRKHEAINQGYQIQTKLTQTQEQEIKKSKEQISQLEKNLSTSQEAYSTLQHDNRDLSNEISEKIKQIDEQNQIIELLESKIKDFAN